jgi:hypothetical protein
MAYPSEAHLLAFGRMVHHFAQVESGIKIALCGILELKLAHAMITFQPYTAQSLKKAAKSLAKERLKPPLADKFSCIVGDWYAHNRLRNDIAHNRWTDGARPNAIKPRYVSINADRADWFGDDDTETDYAPEDIEERAESLNSVNERLKAFLQESGLQSIIEAKIEEASA